MATKPLTAIEKRWIKDMQEVLCSCPSSRLAALATGDKSLGIYDQDALSAWQAKHEFEWANRDDSIHEQIRKAGALLDSVTVDLKIAPA